ncbi:hypothetical protein F5Y17DRAFT_373503 [Xylariaceae sp. FL0594]|nr:hypothetical protein F5Y17DRAFT_373503 [Xylariaceae sp. FL0594]
MSALRDPSIAFDVPEVSQAVTLFANQFLHPVQHLDGADEESGYDYYYEEDEDDGLGYYPDGVKPPSPSSVPKSAILSRFPT